MLCQPQHTAPPFNRDRQTNRRRKPRRHARFSHNGRRQRHPRVFTPRDVAPIVSKPLTLHFPAKASGQSSTFQGTEFVDLSKDFNISKDKECATGDDAPTITLTHKDTHFSQQVTDLNHIDVDPSRQQKDQIRLSMRHSLCQQQHTLKDGLFHRTPPTPLSTLMKSVMPVIQAAFGRRPQQVVLPNELVDLRSTVGHFWRLEDFNSLPPTLFEILRNTFQEEEREIAYVQREGRPSGHRISAKGAATLGMPAHIVHEWDSGSTLPLSEDPKPFCRKPYPSVYASLEVLHKVCEESLRLVQQGKAIPWLRRPFIVSPTACIFKPSAFEPDGVKKRICYDLTASGLNKIIQIPQSSLPTIFTLLESMGPKFFMAKSDLKDMFLNFPIRVQDWTLLGFSHPVTGQYMVIPFYPFGMKNAPPECQAYAEAVRDLINEEAQRRIHHLPSLPGLEVVARPTDGLSLADSPLHSKTHVYIDDFQHLTKLLQQGLEIFEIGAKVFEILGLVEKIVKREGPARVMTLLGFSFDSNTSTLSIPKLKADEIVDLIDVALDMAAKAGCVSFAFLQSLVGKLTWASTGIEVGRTYLAPIRRPLDAVADILTSTARRGGFLIPVFSFPKLIGALQWWRRALKTNDGATLVHTGPNGLYQRWRWEGTLGDKVPAGVVEVFTDACPAGGGWAWGAERHGFNWSPKEKQHHINILEAQTVLKMLQQEGPSLAKCRVLLWCDNMVSVKAIRKGNSSSTVLCDILRSIRLLCLQHMISFWPVHIAGALNVVADGLSRGVLSARSSLWSFNAHIMARWNTRQEGFDVDVFSEPSGRGAQAPRFCSAADPPFLKTFPGLKIFAFPPLELVSELLKSYASWEAASIIAVVPLHRMPLQQTNSHTLLHVYGSHFGIFDKPSGNVMVPCPPIGYPMGVYLLH